MRRSTASSPSSRSRLVKPRALLELAGASLLALSACLAGCGSFSRLSAEPPPAVSLAGTWKLDPLHSTDTDKALRNLVKMGRRRQRGGNSGGEGFGGGEGRRGGPGSEGGPDSADALLAQTATEPLPPDISLQRSLLAGGDWLRIEQRPDEMVITNADTSRSFVPGEHSVVSVPAGVADQKSGWKGKEYWIELRPQVGPSATEKLKLSPDGKALIETIDVASDGRIPRLQVTRVYLPTREIPSAVPSED